MDSLNRYILQYGALNNPVRLQIFKVLNKFKGISFNDLSKKINISRPLLAYHVLVLSEAGIISKEQIKEGKKTSNYFLSEEGKQISLELKERIHPTARDLYNRAKQCYDKEKYDEGIELLNKSIKIEPLYSNAIILRMGTFLRLSQSTSDYGKRIEYLTLMEKDLNKIGQIENLKDTNEGEKFLHNLIDEAIRIEKTIPRPGPGSEPMRREFTKIKDLNSGSKGVTVLAKVLNLGEANNIQTRDGEQKKLNEIHLADETGKVTMSLWNEQARQVELGGSIIVENGYVSLVRGHMRLNVGKYGSIKKADTEVEEINESLDVSKKEYQPEEVESRPRRDFGASKRNFRRF